MIKFILMFACLCGYNQLQAAITDPIWVVDDHELIQRLTKINISLFELEKINEENKAHAENIRLQLWGYWIYDN